MPLGFYFDHNVPRAIAEGLVLRGVEVLTSHADGTERLDDRSLLDRANELGIVLFTMDDDLLREATLRQQQGSDFAGVIYAHQLGCSVGRCIADLEVIARACSAEELRNRVEFLPL